MVEFALEARPPITGPTASPPSGAAVVIAVLPDRGRAILLARRGQAEALAERCRSLGVTLPMAPQRIESRGLGVVWTGPGQWLVDWEDGELERAQRLFASFAALCSTVRADDARACFSVGGPRARDALAKIVSIDLHPRAFKAGDAAVTVAGGISVVLWQRDDSPLFECAVPRSFARSFWDWLVECCAEYGVIAEDGTHT